MLKNIVLAGCLVVAGFTVAEPTPGVECGHSQWEYVGPHSPEHWPDQFPTCNGRKQSPIDIDVYDLELDNIGDIVFNNYTNENEQTIGVVINNGHTSQINLTNFYGYLSGGILKGKYGLSQIHFHWGKHDSMGSEHTVGRERLDMEMHAVHQNLDPAKDDYVVLSYLFKADKENAPNQNDLITQILDTASRVGTEEEERTVPLTLSQFNIQTLLGDDTANRGFFYPVSEVKEPTVLKDYCFYHGSLTTPPCSEIVTWIMTRKLGQVSEQLLTELRSLRTHNKRGHLYNNFRFPQPMHERKLVCNRDHAVGKSAHVITFQLESQPGEIQIALKHFREKAALALSQLLNHMTLTVQEDDNLGGWLSKRTGNGKVISSLQLVEGVVYITELEHGSELVILRNDDRKVFFQENNIFGIGKVILGMEVLNKITKSATIGLTKITEAKSNIFIDF